MRLWTKNINRSKTGETRKEDKSISPENMSGLKDFITNVLSSSPSTMGYGFDITERGNKILFTINGKEFRINISGCEDDFDKITDRISNHLYPYREKTPFKEIYRSIINRNIWKTLKD